MQNYIRNHLARYDGVFIEGYLNYQKCETSDGNTRMSGNIVAIHIEKTWKKINESHLKFSIIFYFVDGKNNKRFALRYDKASQFVFNDNLSL